jgi:aryl-alcohol dehydrogenase-like predicted oxidoreductase
MMAQWQAAEHALGAPVVSNQVQYSLVARGPERAVLPYAREAGRLVIAYSPLGQGFLSARYDEQHAPPGGIRRTNVLFTRENLGRARYLLAALREIARHHDVTPAQVALAWVIRRPNVVAIPGASSVAQLEANAAAADLALSDEEDVRLTEAADRFHPRRGLAAMPEMVTSALRR